MDDISPPEAKSVSAGVRTIPFGMPALDSTLGGLPSGATTLLAGAPDASADAFVYLTAPRSAARAFASARPRNSHPRTGSRQAKLPNHVDP